MQRRRVSDEGIRFVKLCSMGRKGLYHRRKLRLNTCQQPRSYVWSERCPELLGVKGAQAALQVGCEILWLNHKRASKTAKLELRRGKWNSWCSGGMRRYQEEYRWRRRLTGLKLTLRHESVGSKQD